MLKGIALGLALAAAPAVAQAPQYGIKPPSFAATPYMFDTAEQHGLVVPSQSRHRSFCLPTGFFSKPSSILISEGFKVKGGLIQQVEAVGASLPYHIHPGW